MSSDDRLVVEVSCSAVDAELVADRLLSLGASAVAESPGPADGDARVVLSADLDAGSLERFSWPGATVRTVDVGTSWLDAWREHAEVLRAGRFSIRPPWVAAEGAAEHRQLQHDALEIVVDPGRTFGSGSHESTRGCLELLGRHVRDGDSVLDVGCGSGILAVGSLLAGAAHAVGVDIDPQAAEVSVAVAAENGVAGSYQFAGPTVPGGRHDLVVANMLVNELEGIAPAIAAAVRPGGMLVVGGLLEGQRGRALAALRNGCDAHVVDEIVSGGWCSMAMAVREPATTTVNSA